MMHSPVSSDEEIGRVESGGDNLKPTVEATNAPLVTNKLGEGSEGELDDDDDDGLYPEDGDVTGDSFNNYPDRDKYYSNKKQIYPDSDRSRASSSSSNRHPPSSNSFYNSQQATSSSNSHSSSSRNLHSRDYEYSLYKSGSSNSYRSSNSENPRNQTRSRHYDYDTDYNSNNGSNNGRYNSQRQNYPEMNYSSRRNSRDVSRNIRDYENSRMSSPHRDQNTESRNYERTRSIRSSISSSSNNIHNTNAMDEISDEDEISEGEVKEKEVEEGEVEDDDDIKSHKKIYSKVAGSNSSSPRPSSSLRQHSTFPTAHGKFVFSF